METNLSRREMMACTGACLGAASLLNPTAARAEPEQPAAKEPFRYCLNTGTLRGFNLPLVEEVKIAAEAGYQGFEPWLDNVHRYADGGGSLPDLKKRIADLGLTVEGAIGFPTWAAEEDAKRVAGMEQLRRDMDLLAQIGGLRVAVPPAGINQRSDIDLRKVADRYRAVLEMGRKAGILPHLEIWGSAKTLGRVSEAAFVAIETNHPDACVLLDIFHVYRGGSGFNGLRMLSGLGMHVLHVNDYPADPPRETITDASRVFPGDGIAPLGQIFRDLYAAGYRGALSLELFNREYWKREPIWVAKTGLAKTKAAVRAAFSA
jgi:sugar phosphate isomerase/epimerase